MVIANEALIDHWVFSKFDLQFYLAGAPEEASPPSPRAQLNFKESHFHKLSAEKKILKIGQKLTELEKIKFFCSFSDFYCTLL